LTINPNAVAVLLLTSS